MVSEEIMPQRLHATLHRDLRDATYGETGSLYDGENRHRLKWREDIRENEGNIGKMSIGREPLYITTERTKPEAWSISRPLEEY